MKVEASEEKSRAGGKEPRKRRTRKRGAGRDPGEPKRPDSGYIRFLKEQKDVLVGKEEWRGPGSVAAIAADWTALSEDAKRPYLQAAAADKALWDAAVEAYRRSDAHKAFVRAQREREAEERAAGAPEDAALPPGAVPVFSQAFVEQSAGRERALREATLAVGQLEEEAQALGRRWEQLPAKIADAKAALWRLADSAEADGTLLGKAEAAALKALRPAQRDLRPDGLLQALAADDARQRFAPLLHNFSLSLAEDSD